MDESPIDADDDGALATVPATRRGRPDRAPRRDPPVPERPAEHALLGLLALAGGTAHGYELSRRFRNGQPLGEVIRLEPAMLYKHLKKLARLGWLRMTIEAHPPRPPRQVCHLTPAGQAELQRWLTEPVVRTREVRLEFLVKLYFASRLDPSLATRLVGEQRAVMERLADSLAQQRVALPSAGREPGPGPASDATFRRLVLDLRLEQTRSAAAWLARVAAAFGPLADLPAASPGGRDQSPRST